MRMLGRTITTAAALLLLMPRVSLADTLLVLTDPAPADQQYQQTANSPCVIGDPSCKDPVVSWPGEGLIPPNTALYDVTSPEYTVAQIAGLVGNAFSIGIDVNTATGADLATEFLDFFGVYFDGILAYHYGDLNPNTPGHQLANANNGNGFADALLGIVTLPNSGDVTFRAIVSNATAGREEFFLLNTNNPPPVIPEPASLLLLGSGLLGLGAKVRQKRKQQS